MVNRTACKCHSCRARTDREFKQLVAPLRVERIAARVLARLEADQPARTLVHSI